MPSGPGLREHTRHATSIGAPALTIGPRTVMEPNARSSGYPLTRPLEFKPGGSSRPVVRACLASITCCPQPAGCLAPAR